jgi:hypothetical protein
LKKRTKKLLLLKQGVYQYPTPDVKPKRAKVFWFFFSKKNDFLPYTNNIHPPSPIRSARAASPALAGEEGARRESVGR